MTPADKRESWKEYVAGGRVDDGLRNALIDAESISLQKLAWKMHGKLAGQMEVDELISLGVLAMIDASKRYDPSRWAFWTFAAQRALGAMLDACRTNDPVSRRARAMHRRRHEYEQEHFKSHGFVPSKEETAVALGWDRTKLAASYLPEVRSTDSVLFNNDCGVTTLRELLVACDEGPDGHMLSESFFRDVCGSLPFDQQIMLYLYFVRDTTMLNIALAFGVSESRISQLMSQAKEQLMRKLRAQSAA